MAVVCFVFSPLAHYIQSVLDAARYLRLRSVVIYFTTHACTKQLPNVQFEHEFPICYICYHVDFEHVMRDVKILAEYAHRMGTNQDGLVGLVRAMCIVLFVASGCCSLLHLLHDFDTER